MLYDIDARARGLMYRDRMAFIDTAMSWAIPTITVLMSRWARELGPVKVATLVAVVHMTLTNGRIACELPLSIFDRGNADSDECPIFSGLGMSLSSARRHVESLCNDDFLSVYRTISVRGGAEMHARIAEINFKKVFSAVEIARTGIKLDTITPSQIDRGPYEYIHRYFVPSLSSLGLDKSNLLPPVFDTAGEAGETATRRNTMLATPKRQKPVTVHADSAREAIARVTARSTASRTAAAARATAGELKDLTIKDLQALLDTSMQEYFPNHPRMVVTAKPFSMLRKRLIDARVKDLQGFISYVIRYWSILAQQNKVAYRKDPTRLERGAPLPSSPVFITLAYKLPYFIAAYSNHLTDTSKPKEESSATARRLAQVEVQLAQTQAQLVQVKRGAEEQSIRKVVTQPVIRKSLAELQESNDALLQDNWEPPAWPGQTLRKKKA